jgi:hypothetical protein
MPELIIIYHFNETDYLLISKQFFCLFCDKIADPYIIISTYLFIRILLPGFMFPGINFRHRW